MKKIVLALALVLASGPVFACDAHPKAHAGLAVGAHAGYVTADARYQRIYYPGIAQDNMGVTERSARGGLIGLNLSYGRFVGNKLYAGLELKADLQHVKGNQQDLYVDHLFNSQLRAKDSLGAIVKLGYLVDTALPYVTMGLVTTQFEDYLYLVQGGVIPSETKKARRSTGFEVGFGVDLPISDHMTFGARYVHTEYGKFTGAYAMDPVDNMQAFTIHPQTNAFLLNVKYRVW